MIEIRRIFIQIEEIRHEFGPPPEKPLLRGAIAGVLANPYAGRYEADIQPFMVVLDPVGELLANRLMRSMRIAANDISGYGKGAIVGAGGELEHGALWHVPGGYAMRRILGPVDGGKAIVPSTKKVGGPSASLDVPITNHNASYVRGNFDAIEVRVPGAPAADEIVVILAMTTGQRIHDRAGGLKVGQISKFDGQR